ncbi:phage integrase SAM-like domain and Arm DNA-binding domain-containing protein [Alistipes provencensis]|uniref:phage integrase SAM-like domain and Arm DNA-binding domain-containing protein n=1 Tax=Alistipes provencensis TaxID=1816676 RepID=UPI000AB06999|nr:phage integrase SAM-like domain and Arm DNA-binding domain-containing protein [Alistipes provencensis]
MNISINTVFRKDRLNSQNAAPVHLRLTQTRKNKFISTGVTLNIDDWDFENQRIKGNNPEMQELQYRIDTKLNEYRRKIKRLEALEVEVTLDNLLETNGRKINCTVGEYLKQTIERLEILGKYGSASKHRSLLSRLSQFRSLNTRFDEIDLAYLHDFELFLRKEGNTNNSIATKYAIFKAALAEGLFVPKTTPFTKYMATLRYCDIVDGRIYDSRHKTQKLLSFQLVPNAMRIIEKYSKAKQSSATLSC